jgi:hypothetical protein
MMRRRSTERRDRERERLTNTHSHTHTHTHTHTAVENHAVDLRLIQRLTKRDTTLSSRKKKVQKNKGISERLLVSFINLVIFFPLFLWNSCAILDNPRIDLPIDFSSLEREREREDLRCIEMRIDDQFSSRLLSLFIMLDFKQELQSIATFVFGSNWHTHTHTHQ